MKSVRPRNRSPFYTNIMSSVPVPNTFVNESLSRLNAASEYDTPALTKFKEGLSVFENSSKFSLNGVFPIAISPFGPKAGFGYVSANITYKHVSNPISGKPMEVPGLCFIRGDSGAVLTFLNHNTIDYVVLTEQPRVPICDPAFREIPAGMMNEAKGMRGFAAAIVKEMKEEVGLDIDMKTEIKRLGYSILSAGGSDEGVHLFFSRIKCSSKVLAHLEGKLSGVLEENEQVTARILPLSQVRQQIKSGELKDAKLVLSLAYYDSMPELSKWVCERHLVLEGEKPVMKKIVEKTIWATFSKWFSDTFICKKNIIPPPTPPLSRRSPSQRNMEGVSI
jgi:hypothetical protein